MDRTYEQIMQGKDEPNAIWFSWNGHGFVLMKTGLFEVDDQGQVAGQVPEPEANEILAAVFPK